MVDMTKIADRYCLKCGERFTPVRSWQVYCNSSCRGLAWRKAHPIRLTWEQSDQLPDASSAPDQST